jgi:deoxyribonuclease-4
MLLGAHESTSGGLHEAFARALADGAEAVQIFTKSSRMWRAKEITPADAATFRTAAAMPVTVHASYLVNLGADPGDLRDKSIAAFIDELQRCDLLGIPQLVVHPGANADRERGLRNVADALDRTFAAQRGRCQVLLETAAGQGSCLGSRFEELRRIRELTKNPERIAVCVDTCHVFAAGYDVASEKGYDVMFDELDRVLGLDLVRAFHLNDSMKPLGCRVDRHEHVCKGEIGPLAFRKLVNDDRFRDVPGYLEIPPEGNRACLTRLKKLRTSSSAARRRPRVARASRPQ